MNGARLNGPALLARFLPALLAFVLCGWAALATAASSDEGNSGVEIREASGTLTLSDSLSGGAVLTASNLVPGIPVSGDVSIANTGTIPSSLRLTASDLDDTPGPNGGLLSEALNLSVRDLGRNVVVYNGMLNALDSAPVGYLRAGQSRSYRLTATLPDTGSPPSPTSGDNAYMASSISANFDWNAVEDYDEPIEPPVDPPVPPVDPPVNPPANPPAADEPLILLLGGPKTQKMRAKMRTISYTASCSGSCSVSVRAWVSRKKGKKRAKTMMKLRPTTMAMRAGKTTTISFQFSAKQQRKVLAVLKRRWKVYVNLEATARNSSGTTKRTAQIRLVR